MTTPERHCQLVVESQKRHIEKERARRGLKKRVKRGLMPHPTKLQCLDCGKQAECYDHAYGYDGKNRYRVDPVCWPCHRIRGKSRKEYVNGAMNGWRKTNLKRMTKKCISCNEAFSGFPCFISKRKFCSRKCYIKNRFHS